MEWTDGRVGIRPYKPTDVDVLYEAARESVAEVSRWLPWCHEGYSREETVAWIASRPGDWANGIAYDFAIVDGDGRILGGCGLNQINALHHFANLGYWVRTSRAGCGIATAATRLVARFGFTEVGLVRIEIVVDVDNLPSLAVARKTGAKRECVLRNRLVHGARVADAVVFSLIPEDLGLERLAGMRKPERMVGE